MKCVLNAGQFNHADIDGWGSSCGKRRIERFACSPLNVGGGVVKAPMPGLVVRVEVVVGQRVNVGAGLVVVEAMKMENELRATRAGVVETIHVAAGQTVDKGASLVSFAPLPSAER